MRAKWDRNTYIVMDAPQSQHILVGKKQLNADQKIAPVSTWFQIIIKRYKLYLPISFKM